jgi:uncharacterized protein (DUF58 family)
MTHKALLIALLSFGLLLAALIARNGGLALMALPFLAYLGAGILDALPKHEIHLSATRYLKSVPSEGTPAVEVHVIICNQGTRLVPLQISDAPQPAMKVTEGLLKQWVALAAGEETDFQYTFLGERGSYRWKTVRAVASDSFGLFESEFELPAVAELQIQPKITKIGIIPVRPDSTLHAPGSIPARRAGGGTDFWGVREYHPGDSLRRLDWRLSARHPHQFFTKEFEQEEIADIALILDARPKIDVQVGEESLSEHAVNATASLAEMFLRQGHRVSLLTLGDQMTAVFPGYSKRQLNRILRSLASVRPRTTASDLGLDFVPVTRFSSSALIVILSPLAPDDWLIFPRLRAHGNQGLLICPDPIDFAMQTFAQDPPSQLAVRAARLERRLQLNKIAELQIRVVDWHVDQPLAPLVRNAFRQRRGAQRG